MEEINKTSARSFTPHNSSYNTDTDKDYTITPERNSINSTYQKINSSVDKGYKRLDSSLIINSSCSNCGRLEKQVAELNKKLQREKEKLESYEKHTRQFEGLLQIKEKRLKDEEASIKREKNGLNAEIESLKKLSQELAIAKTSVDNENKLYIKENLSLKSNLKKADKKINELKILLNKSSESKNHIEEAIKASILKSFSQRESSLSQKESELKLEQQKLSYENELLDEKKLKLSYFEQTLLLQEQSINSKYEELSNFSAELSASKASLSSDQQTFESFCSHRTSLLTQRELQIRSQEEALSQKLSILEQEFSNLDILKKKLQDQKLLLDSALASLKTSDRHFTKQTSILTSFDSEFNFKSDEKEDYIDEMIERLHEEERKFESRWNVFRKVEETLRKELEYYKNRCEELENCQGGRTFSRMEVAEVEEIENIREIKDEDLAEAQERLERERQEIDSTAELVKSLHEELLVQQKAQEDEKAAMIQERSRLNQLISQQEEFARLLLIKEKEILQLKSSLDPSAPKQYTETISFEDNY